MQLPHLGTAVSLLAAWLGPAAAAGDEMKTISLRTHSLSPPYLDADMQNKWFDFGGDAFVKTDSYIRLAPDLPSRTGWLFSKIPLTASNWEVEFEFKIHGKGSLHGDGMALWITKQRAIAGQVFGSMDKFEGLGIFFDTYKNNRPGVVFPYVMAMVGDGIVSYDKNNDGKDQELAGCSARGIRGATIPTKARLTFIQDTSLKLELRYKSEDEWTTCFQTGAVTLASVSYLGFSAETGELSDNFDIISVETKNLYGITSASGSNTNQSGKKQKSKKATNGSGEGGGWGWFLMKIILFFLVVGGVYVGFTMYRASTKKHSRFN